MPFAVIPWPAGADPTAVCTAAGETTPGERMHADGKLYIYGASQDAADAALAAHPPDITTPARTRANLMIEAQITTLESRQHRMAREMLLGVADAQARLQALDGEIAALRLRRQ